MAAAFFPSAHRTSHLYIQRRPLPLDGSRHPAQFSAREGWFQIYCRAIEFPSSLRMAGAPHTHCR
jgi:hypothetical protein